MKNSGDMFRLIDLFAGAGGMTLGFTDPRFCGGFRCVFSLDNDPAAMETHGANFGGDGFVGDIEDFLRRGPRFRKRISWSEAHPARGSAC